MAKQAGTRAGTAKKKHWLVEILWFALVIVIAAAVFRPAYGHFFRKAYPLGYEELVLRYSRENSLEPALVFAVIRSESGFLPEAQSSIPARGLMQITEDTFLWAQQRHRQDEGLTFDDLFDPEINIKYGTIILGLLLQEYGSEENALCAYHAGWGSAAKWLQDPAVSPDGRQIVNIPYGDTARYVAKVMETKETYQRLYEWE